MNNRSLGIDWEHEILQLQADMRSGSRGMFLLTFDNYKRRGRNQPMRTWEGEGTLYSSGHIHLDTLDSPVTDFESFQQMLDFFTQYGACSLVWLDDERARSSEDR